MVRAVAHLSAVSEVVHNSFIMATCSLCPCPVYDASMAVCYNCASDTSPSAHTTCTWCNRRICVQHGVSESVRDRVCQTCIHRRRTIPTPSEQLVDKIDGVYVPAYARRPCRIASSVRPVEARRDKECLICRCEFGTQPVTALACAHLFHVHCVVPWFRRSLTCPLCRHAHIVE